MSAKLDTAIELVRARFPTARLRKVEKALAIDPSEHVTYHDWCSRAQAHGIIDLEVAQWLSGRLGSVWRGQANGGWPAGVDAATKVVVTQFLGSIADELRKHGLVAA